MNCHDCTSSDQCGRAGRIGSCVTVIALLALVWGVPVARACNTPVYRYAMDNWAPAPYYVFYFHRGGEAEEDKQVNRTLAGLAEGATAVANVAFLAVDVSEEQQLDRLGEFVNKLWQSDHGGKVPMHLMLSPRGAELFAGRLEPAAIQAMVGSPVRTRLGELFEEGHAAVLLMLPGSDAAANRQAEKVADQMVAQATSGEIPGVFWPGPAGFPGTLPAEGPDDTLADDAQGPPSGTLKVAFLKVSRTDPAEKWLVRSLMAIEPDLHELVEQPMIFTIFGRARALEPCVGKGINEDNLGQDLAFLSGPCSCMVKEQNPGVDLLVRWDWEATAIATSDEWLPGGQLAYQEFVPGEQGNFEPSSTPQPTSEVAASATSAESTTSAQIAASAASADAAAADAAAVPSATTAQPQTAQGKARDQGPDPGPAGSFAIGQIWKLGIGVALATVIVLVAGFIFVRRQ